MNKIALILSVVMIAFGAGSTLSSKAMYGIKIPGFEIADTNPQEFIEANHPAIYTTLMFVGEFLCLPTYGGLKLINHKRGKERQIDAGKLKFKPIPHAFLFMVPTIFDLVASQLFSMGNYFSLASVYQVLRNLTVPFVALFSFILFKDYRKRFDLHSGLGLLLILAGAAGTGVVASIYSNAAEAARNPFLGVLCTVGACLFAAGFFFSEEVGLRRIDAHPFQGVGTEGMWGIVFYIILLPIFNTIKDPFGPAGSKMADLSLWAKMFSSSGLFVGYHFINLISVFGFNAAGMAITKYASASSRVTMDGLRTIVVWCLSFAFGWESWHNIRTPIQIGCFIILFTGVLMYNRVLIKLPYFRKANKEDEALAAMGGHKVDNIEVQENINGEIEV